MAGMGLEDSYHRAEGVWRRYLGRPRVLPLSHVPEQEAAREEEDFASFHGDTPVRCVACR